MSPDRPDRIEPPANDPSGNDMWSESLSMEHIRTVLRGDYDRWVDRGVWIALIGYIVASGARLVRGDSVSAWLATLEPLAALVMVGCLALVRTGRPRLAVQLALASIWVQVTVNLPFNPDGIRGTAPAVFVFLVMSVNVLVGPKWAFLVSAATTVVVPAGVALGGWSGGPGLGSEDLVILCTFLVALWGTAVLQTGFLRSFWAILSQLRTNEARFAAMVDGAPDAVVGVDPNGLVDTFNPAAERALGARASDVLGQPFSRLPLESLAGSALETHSGPRELMVPGRGIVLEAMVRRIPGPERTNRLLLVLRDVTARRAAEARAQELNKQLQHAQRLEAVGRLAGGVAHDFNNLLTAIGGGASFLQDHPDPEVREIAAELQSAQERGAALTRQLLSFARKEVRSPKVIELRAFLEAERTLLQRIIGERIVLDLDLSGPASILLDEGQLEQVLLNLTVNSRDAMPDGGTLYVGCRTDGAHDVLLIVRDTGTGMTEEVRRHLFEPFYTTKGMDGTGLGLSTVHGIVTNGGGSIEVESEPGVGSEFRLRMPRAPDREPERAPKRPEPVKRKARILLVEDDDLTRDFARRALIRMGHTVEVARNGAEALDRIGREAPFELVLSDVTMPVMTGPELLERIREQGSTVPVLLMSGYVDDVLREGTFDVTTQLLLKPFSMDELSRRVNDALVAVRDTTSG